MTSIPRSALAVNLDTDWLHWPLPKLPPLIPTKSTVKAAKRVVSLVLTTEKLVLNVLKLVITSRTENAELNVEGVSTGKEKAEGV